MKKTISIILTVLMLILNLQINFVIAEDTVLKPEEAGLLEALALINEDGFAEEDYLTRAEFCNVICRLFNFSVVTGESNVPFRDIDDTHPYFYEVSLLYNRGIIKGLSKYQFAPNRYITKDEAATIAVTALGFAEIVKSENSSMLAKANELGIFDGISLTENNVSEDMVKKLMYNILFAPIAKVASSGKGISYETDEALMMNEIYDLYEVKGVVTENSVTSFYGESSIGDDQIKIDSSLYINATENLDSLMGYSVFAYVIYDKDGEGTVIYAYENEKKNNVSEFMSEDITDLNDSLLSFDSDGKEVKVEFSNSMDVIYNGIGIKSYTTSTLKPKYGHIKLIDHDTDKKADLAIVTEYKGMVVQNVVSSDTEFNVYDKYGNNIVADLVEKDCMINVWKNGQAAKISDIVSGSAILLVDSGARETRRIINIYLFKEKISGVLAGIDDKEITVDDKSFEISPYLDIEATKYYMSKQVSCYVDINDRLAFVTVESGEQYGFLYRGVWQEDSEDLLLRVLTTDNEWKAYLLADKINFNTESKKDSDVYTALLNGKSSVEQQVIRFETNEDGKITKLYTAQFKTNEDGSLDVGYDEELRDKGMFRKSMLYKWRQFAHEVKGMYVKQGYSSWVEVFFTGTVPVLVRPQTDVTDEKQCHWYTQSYFKTEHNYYCEGFDLKEDNCISMMVVYQDLKYTVTGSDAFIVVDKIISEVNEEQEVVKKLYGYYKGVLTGFEAANDNAFLFDGKEVKRGDIVKVAKDPNENVDHLDEKLRFSVTSPENYITNYDDQTGNVSSHQNSAYASRQIPVGTVSKVYGDYVRMEVQNSQYINLLLRSTTKYVVYDANQRAGSELRVGTKNDIAIGDYIVAGISWGKVEDIIIYKLD